MKKLNNKIQDEIKQDEEKYKNEIDSYNEKFSESFLKEISEDQQIYLDEEIKDYNKKLNMRTSKIKNEMTDEQYYNEFGTSIREYKLSELILDDLIEIKSCGSSSSTAYFNDCEIEILEDFEDLNQIVDTLDKNNIKYSIQYIDNNCEIVDEDEADDFIIKTLT